MKLAKENYWCLIKRLPPDKTEVWLKLEPDKLVMQIALAQGEKTDNEITAKPTY